MNKTNDKNINKFPVSIIKAILLLSCLIIGTNVDAETGDIKDKLNKLSLEFEKQRVALHIPGMALAIVRDGKVIFAKGFGVADLERQIPVTPKTIFAIGSSSKAFTATIIGMLVDQKKMQWDDPAVKYLPFYQFTNNGKKLDLTIRDMLSHRSGYARNDVLWLNGKVSAEEILKDATQAEPWAPFHQQFHYNNVMYLAAGIASAKQQDSSWNVLLENMILKPLGMENTTADYG